MHEKRLTTRLTNYWELIRKDQPMPVIHWFNPAAVQDIWPQCFTLAIQPGTQSSRVYLYEHFGKKIVEVYGNNLTGKIAGPQMKMFPGNQMLKRVDQAVADSQPLLEDGQFINDKSRIVKYRACLLPFGTATQGVTHVIVGLSWQAF